MLGPCFSRYRRYLAGLIGLGVLTAPFFLSHRDFSAPREIGSGPVDSCGASSLPELTPASGCSLPSEMNLPVTRSRDEWIALFLSSEKFARFSQSPEFIRFVDESLGDPQFESFLKIGFFRALAAIPAEKMPTGSRRVLIEEATSMIAGSRHYLLQVYAARVLMKLGEATGVSSRLKSVAAMTDEEILSRTGYAAGDES